MDYFGWDGQEDTKPRELLQKLGTEVIRDELGMINFFPSRVAEDITILKKYFNVFIVDDIRY